MFVHEDVFMPFFDEINKKTDGRVVIDYYFDGELYGHIDAFDAVNRGMLDITYGSLSYFIGYHPSLEYGSLFFLISEEDFISNYKETYEMTDQLLRKSNAKLLTLMPMSRNAIITVSEVTKPRDIEGLRIRGASAGEISLIEEYGGIPASMSPGEVHDALDKGAINGVFSVLEGIRQMHWQEVADYIVYPTGFPVYCVAMNFDVWESLPDDVKQVIEKASENLFDLTMELGSKKDRETLELFEEAGKHINILSDEKYKFWREQTQPVYDNYLKNSEEAGEGDFARRILEMYR